MSKDPGYSDSNVDSQGSRLRALEDRQIRRDHVIAMPLVTGVAYYLGPNKITMKKANAQKFTKLGAENTIKHLPDYPPYMGAKALKVKS